jgi:hypothetical protein
MESVRAKPPEPDPALWTTLALWIGFSLGPTAWAVQLELVYAAAQQACQGDITITTLHMASGVCLIVSILGGVSAAWHWFRTGAAVPSQFETGIVTRRRFLSIQGMFTGALFAIIIAAQWLAIVYLSPCPSGN